MRFFIPSVIALAVSVAALPERQAKMGKLANSAAFSEQTSGVQCNVGHISCCNNAKETRQDGILSGLLGGGLLNGLAGNSGSACAKAGLIDDLGLLALISTTETGPVCKNIIACCPEGVSTSIAVDNSGNQPSGY